MTGADAHKTDNGINYFTSDMLNNKLSTALAANATTVKNALETAVKNGGVAMPETDATGHTSASDMEQGLYLVVETRVPENVTSTCNTFFVSLPMTTIDGAAWNYDVTVYPKNQTGNPTLDKTVREAKNSTGKNTGSLTDIKDGYTHTATASVGDTVDYQIISTLPTITSKASALSEYTYVDTLSKGIKYNKNDVVIEFFKDAGCTDKIATWAENSGKFTVGYDDTANTMTICMIESGLSEINESESVYTDSVKRGYSDCTMRITYAATLTADAKMGHTDNPNEVVLTWKRTNTTYFDTLKDCCHVYTYGIDVLKQFSGNGGNLRNVKFKLHNDTDDCYIIADLKSGVYYAKGFAEKKADATTFVPNSSGHIVVKGLEDDAYDCNRYRYSAHTVCASHYIRHERLLAAVTDVLDQQVTLTVDVERLIHEIDHSVELTQAKREKQNTATSLRLQRQSLDRKLDMLIHDLSSGLIGREEFLYAKEKYRAELNRILAAEATQKERMEQMQKGLSTAQAWVRAMQEYQRLPVLTKELLDTLVERISIHGDRSITIQFNYADPFAALQPYRTPAKEAACCG